MRGQGAWQGRWVAILAGDSHAGERGSEGEGRMRNSKIDKRNIEIATMTNCNVAQSVRKRGVVSGEREGTMHCHLTETNGEREGNRGREGETRSAARASLPHRHLNINRRLPQMLLVHWEKMGFKFVG